MLLFTDLILFSFLLSIFKVFQNLEGYITWLLSFEKVCKDVLGCHLVVSTGSVDEDCNFFSLLLEELAWVVVFFKRFPCFTLYKLFLMVLQLLHPVARVAAV